MGIPEFRVYLRKKYPKAFKQIQTKGQVHDRIPFDHILIDLNEMVHNALRKAETEKAFNGKLFAKLNRLLSHLIPTKSLYLALDGPASIAKLMTQRARRSKPSSAKKEGKKPAAFSSLEVTPGTDLMFRVKQALLNFASWCVQNPQWKGVKITVCGSDSIGEGETKIVEQIKRLEVNGMDESFLIVGSDADLILMGLLCQTRHVTVASSLTKPAPDGAYELLSIKTVRMLLQDEIGAESKNVKLSAELTNTICTDFCLLSMFKGNDYLPKLKFANFEAIWKIYLKVKIAHPDSFLVDFKPSEDGSFPKITINFSFLLSIFEQVRIPVRFQVEKEEKEETEEDNEDDKEEEEEEDLGEIDVGGKVVSYIRMLHWIFHLYSTGHCLDYKAYYTYHHSPSVREIVEFFHSIGVPNLSKSPKALYYTPDFDQHFRLVDAKNTPPEPFKSPLYLLPGIHSRYVPKPLQFLMEKEGPLFDIFWPQPAPKRSQTKEMLDFERLESTLSQLPLSVLKQLEPSHLNHQRSVVFFSTKTPNHLIVPRGSYFIQKPFYFKYMNEINVPFPLIYNDPLEYIN